MKNFFIILLSLNLIAAVDDIEQSKKAGLKMIESIKSIGENLINNKKSFVSMLNIFGDSIPEEDGQPKPNVVIDSPEGKIELTIDTTRKELAEYVDSDYNMKYFKSSIHDIKDRLTPLVNLESYYAINNQRLYNNDDDDFPLELNKKTYWMVNELYQSQDPIRRDIMVLHTNLTNLRDPDFRVCDFYFNGHYRTTENKIYINNFKHLEELKKDYLLEKSQIMWNVADALKFTNSLESDINVLFNLHHKLFQVFSSKASNSIDLKRVDDDTLDYLEGMFKVRVKIAESLQLILREINEFEGHKDNFQRIFNDAEKEDNQAMIKVKQIEDSGINPEEYFKSKEKETKDKSIQLDIEEKLASGQIKMSDIEDTDIADNIINNPILKEEPEAIEQNPADKASSGEPLLNPTPAVQGMINITRVLSLVIIGSLLSV